MESRGGFLGGRVLGTTLKHGL